MNHIYDYLTLVFNDVLNDTYLDESQYPGYIWPGITVILVWVKLIARYLFSFVCHEGRLDTSVMILAVILSYLLTMEVASSAHILMLTLGGTKSHKVCILFCSVILVHCSSTVSTRWLLWPLWNWKVIVAAIDWWYLNGRIEIIIIVCYKIY